MIIKHFEINKISLPDHNYYLFYGKNEGLKKEIINNMFLKKTRVRYFDMKRVTLLKILKQY